MKRASLFFGMFLLLISSANAKIWRVNNTPGVSADFADLTLAHNSASVLAGDTIHLEPSNNTYSGITLTKNLVIIGVGYFLDPANPSYPVNAGLQVSTTTSRVGGVTVNTTAVGSRFIGIVFSGGIQFSGNGTFNVTIEKCYFPGTNVFGSSTIDGLIVRKCYFEGSVISISSGNLTNFIAENNIFAGNSINVSASTGTGNIVRNNSFRNSGGTMSLANCYVANNIFGYFGIATFSNCTVKNNLFAQTSASQPVPGTATGNQFGVDINGVVYAGGSGSLDSRAQLKVGSPAIGAGVTVGAVVSPDCGAFGGTDPYKLSGIPNIPSIYALTAPISIPAGTNSMNVTISTRNNN